MKLMSTQIEFACNGDGEKLTSSFALGVALLSVAVVVVFAGIAFCWIVE